MAITATVISVGTAATAIYTPSSNASLDDKTPGWITTTTATTAYLGGSGVTTALGYPLANGSAISVSLFAGDTIYAITATASTSVAIMKGRQ